MPVSDDHADESPSDMMAAFQQNRRRWEDRFPEMSGWLAPTTAKRVEAVVADAAKYKLALDFSEATAAVVEEYIRRVEQMARVALDLDDGAWVGEDVAGLIDLPALGAYYGELFVRHVGAVWTVAEGHDGPEPAVARGGVTVFPLAWVRWRVDRGSPPPDLGEQFRSASAAMSAGADG